MRIQSFDPNFDLMPGIRSGGHLLGQSNLTSKDLYLITMAALLSQVHEMISDSWEQFADTTRKFAEKSRRDHKTRQSKKTQEQALENKIKDEWSRREAQSLQTRVV